MSSPSTCFTRSTTWRSNVAVTLLQRRYHKIDRQASLSQKHGVSTEVTTYFSDGCLTKIISSQTRPKWSRIAHSTRYHNYTSTTAFKHAWFIYTYIRIYLCFKKKNRGICLTDKFSCGWTGLRYQLCDHAMVIKGRVYSYLYHSPWGVQEIWTDYAEKIGASYIAGILYSTKE